ncbi:MAG: phage tail tape measure protein [Lachnospiraceae bacterium]
MASTNGDLKRVGIEFTAEGAVDFKKNLKDINSAVRENYAAFKLAKSAYDEHTSSTQKLTDRQKYLQGATEAYTEKVKNLSAELEEMKNDESTSTSALKNKQAQLETTQAKLNQYNSELKDVNKQLNNHAAAIKDAGQKMQDIGGKVTGVGESMTKNVTAPIAGIATASIAAFTQVDEGMDTVVTKTGASGKALQDMQDRAKAIATTIPVSFADAGEAIGEVNTRFGATGDQLQNLSTEFLKFAEINGTDVTGSVDSVQKAMAAFGLSTKDTNAVLGSLTQAGQASGISMDTLTSDLVSSGTGFREMGYSIQDSIDMLAELEKSGINTNDVLKGMKKAQAEAASSGTSMSDVLKKAFSSSGDAVDIFGRRVGPQLYAAAQQGTLSVSMFTDGSSSSLSDFAGTVDKTFEETADPIDKFKVILNQLAETGSNLVEAAGPTITQVATQLIDVLNRINEGWQKLPAPMQETIIKIALVAAAIGPAVVGLGKFIEAGGTLVKTVGNIAEHLPALSALVGGLTGPFGAVVIAITAAITTGVLLYKNWDKIKEAASKLGEHLKEKWNSIKEHTSNTWNNIKDHVSNAMSNIQQSIQSHGGGINGVIGAYMDGYRAVWRAGFDFMNQITGGRLGEMASAVQSRMASMQASIQSHGGGMRGAIGAAMSAMQSVWQNGFNALNSVTGGRLGNMLSSVRSHMNTIGEAFSSGLNRIRGFFNGLHLSFPHINLPHFRMSGSFSLNPPRVPRIGIDWYARAMQSAYVLTRPTIFGASGTNLLGGGEAGNEVVTGENHLLDMIQGSVAVVNRQTSIQPNEIQNAVQAGVVAAFKSLGLSVNIDGDKVGEFISDYLRREVLV